MRWGCSTTDSSRPAVQQYRAIKKILENATRIYPSIDRARYADTPRMISGGIHPAKMPSRNNSILPIAFPLWSLPLEMAHSYLLCARAFDFRDSATESILWPQSFIPGTRYRFGKNLELTHQKSVFPRWARGAPPADRSTCSMHEAAACAQKSSRRNKDRGRAND